MIEFADVVVGLSYGDEGKGKIVHALCEKEKYTHCIRFSGGNNAGHTIYHNGKKIVSHSIPTGIVHGIKSIIGPGCVVNVEHFFKELAEMKEAGVKTDGLVFVAKNTHIITQQQKQQKQQQKQQQQKQQQIQKKKQQKKKQQNPCQKRERLPVS